MPRLAVVDIQNVNGRSPFDYHNHVRPLWLIHYGVSPFLKGVLYCTYRPTVFPKGGRKLGAGIARNIDVLGVANGRQKFPIRFNSLCYRHNCQQCSD